MKTNNDWTKRQLMQASASLGLGAASASLLPARSSRAATWSLKADSGQPVYFRGWEYRTDIVKDNVDRYNKALDGKIDYATVTGDYPSLMEQNLVAKANLDMLYANPGEAVRYYEGGWILPVNDLPNSADIIASMYPNILDAHSHKGKLLGLSYFATTRGVIHLNIDKWTKAGFTDADFPKTWSELYAILYKLRDKGEKQPFLPHWFNEWFGISWGFAFEVMNRGGQLADDETHKPLMTADGAAGATLTDWKKLWKDGFIPEEVLSYNESAFLDGFRSGRYVFSPQQAYDLKEFNRPDHSPNTAGKISFLPYQGQSWGLINSAVYLMTSRRRPDAVTEDVKRFASWYGYKDENGDVFVGNRWMQESMLFSAYKEVMEGPLAAKTMRAALAKPGDYERLLGNCSTRFEHGLSA
jgi:multiple sugar transport system substrate-binding protein